MKHYFTIPADSDTIASRRWTRSTNSGRSWGQYFQQHNMISYLKQHDFKLSLIFGVNESIVNYKS